LRKIKKEGVIFTITVALGILSFFAIGLNILALNDIYHDYTSLEGLEKTGNNPKKELPAWSRCTAEWSVIRYGHLVLVLFFIFLIVSMLRRETSQPTNKQTK